MASKYKLKDFQEETANHIVDLFVKEKRKNVLLADEVGLGKTIVAKAVIEKLYNKIKKNKGNFNVLYVCSNISIANQNCEKLGSDNEELKYSDGRLSMQHLKIEEKKNTGDEGIKILPMTPATSFTFNSKSGTKEERALMFLILSKSSHLKKYKEKLNKLFRNNVNIKYWSDIKNEYKKRIKDVKRFNKNYVEKLNKKINNYINDNKSRIIDDTILILKNNKINKISSKNNLILEWRKIFANVSIEDLNPDLIIMDEFQRFKDLLQDENEANIIVKKLFKNEGAKVMLLSATPYKPYTTFEEIEQGNVESHYKEFEKLFDFLVGKIDCDSNTIDFHNLWEDYSNALYSYVSKDESKDKVYELKNEVENEMYSYMSRTERLGNVTIDLSDDIRDKEIVKGDILVYKEIQNILKDNFNFNIDFVKSTPYPLSYMFDYTVYEKIQANIRNNRQLLKVLNNSFLDYKKINDFEKLYENNFRLKHFIDNIFNSNKNSDKYGSEFLLWIPATKPYYNVNDNVFSNNRDYSKTLVFSSWAMVPRMLASMTSYECERRILGQKDIQRKYFSRKTYQMIRKDGRTNTYDLLTYVSVFLSECYDPISFVNKKIEDIESIKNKVKKNIQEKLKNRISSSNKDENKSFNTTKLLSVLKDLEEHDKKIKISKEMYDTLVELAIGSPAICAYRLFNRLLKCEKKDIDINNKAKKYAKELSECFVALFNKKESVDVLKILYPNDEYFYKIIKYCIDGNLQSVIDEYAFVLGGDSESLIKKMKEGFGDNTSIQIVLKKNFLNNQEKREELRCHFAKGNFNEKRGDEKSRQTMDNVRNEFNSPFKPFVLVSTSIGQEGLDFHNYCRKIVHWNLPHNPIDFEQREGRINRYLCHAIRQNLANKIQIKPKKDYWEEMLFEASKKFKKDNSDLVPFWCLPNDKNDTVENENFVRIERYVPMYPFSMDQEKYNNLLSVLRLYRLTLGQKGQETLMDLLKDKNLKDREIEKLSINLSPWCHKKKSTKLTVKKSKHKRKNVKLKDMHKLKE